MHRSVAVTAVQPERIGYVVGLLVSHNPNLRAKDGIVVKP